MEKWWIVMGLFWVVMGGDRVFFGWWWVAVGLFWVMVGGGG